MIDFSILSVNCSHLCIINVKIYEKILSGGLEVSFSIYTMKVTFLKCQILIVFFSVLQCKKGKSRSHGERKNATLSAKFVLKNAYYFYKGSFFGFN